MYLFQFVGSPDNLISLLCQQGVIHSKLSLTKPWSNQEQPRAKAEVFVESLGKVGQLCGDHLRIMLQYGDRVLTLLLTIWEINELSLNDCKCVAFFFYHVG